MWTGQKNDKGYGIVSGYPDGSNGKQVVVRAHRMAWEMERGPIPAGMHVLHECDNPSCVNVAHLFIGTHGDNMRDMCKKGRHPNSKRTHCPHGHPYSKENTCLSNGRRYCLMCVRLYDKAKRNRP